MPPVAAEASAAPDSGGGDALSGSLAATKTAVTTPMEAQTCAMPPTTKETESEEKKKTKGHKPPPSPRHARLIVLAGPCGSGKTTVGRALSALLSGSTSGAGESAAAAPVAVPFLDADDYHDATSKSKMSSGKPLDDADRLPWLSRVAAASRDAAAFSPSHVAVLACSALKKKYRDLLVEVANEATVPRVNVDFVLLKAAKESLRARLEGRQERLRKSSGAAEEVAGHFLHPSLLESQLETWEASEDVVVVENDGSGGSGGGADAAAARTAAETVLRAVGLG